MDEGQKGHETRSRKISHQEALQVKQEESEAKRSGRRQTQDPLRWERTTGLTDSADQGRKVQGRRELHADTVQQILSEENLQTLPSH